MLIKTNTNFKIEDFCDTKNGITLYTSGPIDFDLLRKSETLNVTKRVKTAKVVTIAPKENDFLYVRNRAVSAGNVIDHEDGVAELIPIEEMYKFFSKYASVIRGSNDNGDFFSHEELIKKYKTFIGKATFVDHDNENVEKARGIILDAVYNNKGKFVELLKAVDRKAYPDLARSIEAGYVTDTSMGCRCGYSICSICNNEAHQEEDFCEHVVNYKGSTFNGLPVFEDNRDIEFFEDSFVVQGADKDAKIMEKVANKHNRIITLGKSSGNNNQLLTRVASEKNQRTSTGRIDSLYTKLDNLPWS